MRIALVTPYSIRSAISSWARLLAHELDRRGHDVTIVRAETAMPHLDAPLALPALDAPAAIILGRDADPAELMRQHDIIIYALGNHFGHHFEIPRLLERAPGVIILHDADMSGFLWGWNTVAYADECLPPGTDSAALLAWLATRATGAILHSQFYADSVQQSCLGPVGVLRLSFPDLDVPPPPPRLPASRMTVATLGDANVNKRHLSVIEAIGSVPHLRDNLVFRVLGHATPERQAELAERAHALDVGIEFFGWLSLDELRSALTETDALCCLRWPVTEGASASAIVGLLSGRPVIVPDIGSFADLPDEFVLRVPAGDEVARLAGHLSTLLHHPEVGVQLGTSARAWARETFLTTHYVDGLLPLLERARAAAPMIGLMRRLQAEALELGIAETDPVMQRARTTAERALGAIDPASNLNR